MLEDSSINYVGYIEGNDIVENKADVIVTDGFTGNIAIKAMEGTIGLMVSVLKDSLNDDSIKEGSQFALDIFKKSIDPGINALFKYIQCELRALFNRIIV